MSDLIFCCVGAGTSSPLFIDGLLSCDMSELDLFTANFDTKFGMKNLLFFAVTQILLLFVASIF